VRLGSYGDGNEHKSKRLFMKCSICQKEIENNNGWDKGHNAEPVNSGRCCDVCNYKIVIPARMTLLFETKNKTKNKNDSNSRIR
jgi:hypothetical protein